MLPSIRQLHPGGEEWRRRQALSCTWCCKRRKIRCDRNQPCAPTSVSGTVVEPAEKYATRAEYDELKARVEHLEALVERLTQSQSQSQTQSQPGPPPFITPPPQPKNWAALTFLVLGGRQRCSRRLHRSRQPSRRYTGPGSPFNPPYQSPYSPYSPYPYSRSFPDVLVLCSVVNPVYLH
ncbi:uncharacterized protein EV420DRAFT_1584435, partial [Desarmillaria tabescens]